MFWCDGAESRARPGAGQIKRGRGSRRAIAALLVVGLAPGCSSVERMYGSRLSLDTPVEWWHGLQGGRIAELRPPPPGVTDPYPNLAQVPPRPVTTDAATRRTIAAQLAGERDRARRDAANDPLTLPGEPPPPAALSAPAARTAAAPAPVPAPPPAPPPDPDASVVVLDAASAPPATPSPPAAPSASPPAPVAPVASALPPEPAPAREDAGPLPGGQNGVLPELADAPPSAPRLPGVPTTPAQESPRTPPGVVVAFPRGSAEVPAEAQAALRALAAQRGAAAVTVQGMGDARATTPDAQAAALPLALRRAQAVAAVLTAAGVPPGVVRVGAQATGRGTAARLVD